jgi:hypothetical protein
MTNHPNRSRQDRPGDRIQNLGAMVAKIPDRADWPNLIARIARMWAELHEADQALARELARKLPAMRISRAAMSNTDPGE